jgi:hypothetical protein
MLHTLETGRVGSKLAGARWAAERLDPRWKGLIQRAWEDRPDPSTKIHLPADPDDLIATVAFVRYALHAASGSGVERGELIQVGAGGLDELGVGPG